MRNVLILNVDGSPVNMLPLSTISWEESIKYMFLDKVTVLEWYHDWVVRSVNWSTPVPAVVMLKEYMKKKHTIRFTKQNVFLRDNFRCGYCGIEVTKKTATIDHILPKSLGGKTSFENTITCCEDCNSKKGNNSKIRPKKVPTKPTYYQLVEARKNYPFDLHHPSWKTYLDIKS